MASALSCRQQQSLGCLLLNDSTPVKTDTVDMVNSPPHYTLGGIETIDFIEAKGLNYHLGQVVKYVSRADSKGKRLEDLKKAQWYLNREIEISEQLEKEFGND
jgi:hypothetical protein